MIQKRPLSKLSPEEIIDHYQMERMPVEGTLYKGLYRSSQVDSSARPLGTSMIGMYSHRLKSVSCFHRLKSDEVWHFYGGDSIRLYLLFPDGSHETVILGCNILDGEKLQYVIPAGVWQAGELIAGGDYGLFSCTMAPGFYGPDFEAAIASELINAYPACEDVILRLAVNGIQRKMPKGYEE